MKNQTFQITPLGAATVEAMPDRESIKRINRDFRRSHKCPTSKLFNAAQVRKFYAGKIKPVMTEKAVLKIAS